jgi:hypothetical protein
VKWTFRLLVIVASLSLTTSGFAHDVSSSYARLRVEGSHVHVQFTVALIDFHNGPNLDKNGDGIVTRDELDAGIGALAAKIESNYVLEAPEAPSSITIETYDLQGEGVVKMDLLYTFDRPVRNLKVTSTLDRVTQANHQHLLVTGGGDDTRQGVLDVNHPSVNIYVEGHTAFEIVPDLLTLGFERSLTDYDHLVFLAGILLLATTLTSAVQIVASFVAANSLTLILATWSGMTPPPRLIESLIALSIAIVAMETFVGRTIMARWKVALLFGLVHGFGYAGILTDMQIARPHLAMSLLAFDAGLDAGQLLFVCVLFPLIAMALHSKWKEQFRSAAAVVIMGLGFYWFVQRAFLT